MGPCSSSTSYPADASAGLPPSLPVSRYRPEAGDHSATRKNPSEQLARVATGALSATARSVQTEIDHPSTRARAARGRPPASTEQPSFVSASFAGQSSELGAGASPEMSPTWPPAANLEARSATEPALAPSRPRITVHIERITVRAAANVKPPKKRDAPSPGPAVSLDAYLARTRRPRQ
jgi:hypothetical protein